MKKINTHYSWKTGLIQHSSKLIAIVLCVGIILAPLVFNPTSLFPYEHLQVIVWRSLVTLSGGLFLLHLLFNGTYYSAKDYHLLFIGLGLLLSSALLSTILSVSPTVAWWGSSYRFQGLFTLIHYIVGTLIIMIGLEKKYISWIIWSIVISGTAASVLAIGQRLGLDPWAWPVRVFGSFGHPNFLAAFLVITALVTIGTLQRPQRWFGAASLYLQVTTIFLTFTRTAWVAYLVPSCLMMIVLWWRRTLFSKRRLIFIMSTIMLTFGLGYLSARLINKNAQYAYAVFSSTAPLPFVLEEAGQSLATTNPLDDRVRSITNLQEGSMLVRWYIWQDVIGVIQAHPWLGIGQDTLYIVYPEFYQSEPRRPAIAQSTYTDRAHNEILDVLLNYGTIGLVLWLFCYGIIGLTLLRALKKITNHEDLIIVAAVGGSLLSYWLFNLLGFAVTMTAALFWIGVGILYKYSAPPQREKKLSTLTLNYKPLIAVLGGITLLLLIIRYNVFPAFASYYGYQAVRPGITTLEAERNLQQAIQLAPAEQRYYTLLAETYVTNALATTDSAEQHIWLDQARITAERAADLGLDHLAFWELMVRIYDQWPERDYGQAEKQKYEQYIITRIPYFGENE